MNKLHGKHKSSKKRTKKKMPSRSSDISTDSNEPSSSDLTMQQVQPKQDVITTSKTITTDVETTTVVSTTTTVNRYTWTKISDEENKNEKDKKQEKKTRTKSCSSILDDKLDIIEKLAVFRKSFDNVQIFQDAGLALFQEADGKATGKPFTIICSHSTEPPTLQFTMKIYVAMLCNNIIENGKMGYMLLSK